ncbi:MAG TPA: hypothetical protein VLE99_03475 [Candidatus Saccharimonadales bacterium]|nr:hypothetical protein [Candidatus Saccharimonadales bacterium]
MAELIAPGLYGPGAFPEFTEADREGLDHGVGRVSEGIYPAVTLTSGPIHGLLGGVELIRGPVDGSDPTELDTEAVLVGSRRGVRDVFAEPFAGIEKAGRQFKAANVPTAEAIVAVAIAALLVERARLNRGVLMRVAAWLPDMATDRFCNTFVPVYHTGPRTDSHAGFGDVWVARLEALQLPGQKEEPTTPSAYAVVASAAGEPRVVSNVSWLLHGHKNLGHELTAARHDRVVAARYVAPVAGDPAAA